MQLAYTNRSDSSLFRLGLSGSQTIVTEVTWSRSCRIALGLLPNDDDNDYYFYCYCAEDDDDDCSDDCDHARGNFPFSTLSDPLQSKIQYPLLSLCSCQNLNFLPLGPTNNQNNDDDDNNM